MRGIDFARQEIEFVVLGHGEDRVGAPLGYRAGGVRLGQRDLHAGSRRHLRFHDGRGGHHEDDEEHEEYVGERCDVDFRDDRFACLAFGLGIRAGIVDLYAHRHGMHLTTAVDCPGAEAGTEVTALPRDLANSPRASRNSSQKTLY